jgi:DNA-binding NarL/FixJ family response regulator
MDTTKRVTVMIADDHPMILGGLKDMIERQDGLQLVAQARNGKEAVRAYLEYRPDVALIDLNMPEMNGLQAISQIRTHDPAARIIILTSFDGEEDIFRGMAAGARAYLLKDAPVQSIVDCIKIVAEGGKFLPQTVAAKLAERFDSDQLSGRELEILQLVAAGKSNKMISRIKNIAEGTTKFHVNSIFAKLQVNCRTEAVNVAIRRGLVKI